MVFVFGLTLASAATFTNVVSNCSGAIISLEKETDEKMISQLSQFVDKVVEVK